MNLFSKEPAEMTLDQMFSELAWSDSGEFSRWNLETRDLPGMIFVCCEELSDLSQKAEVLSWSTALHREGVGEDFYRGLSKIAQDVQHRIRVVEAIIRKATIKMQKKSEAS